jgi:predicted nucleotidyltransferase
MRHLGSEEQAAATRAIAAITERIVQNFQPEQIILFGSHARGEADSGSDIDLLVVLSNAKDKRTAAADVRRILIDVVEPTDILVATPEEIERRGRMIGSALRPALREGKVLYERPFLPLCSASSSGITSTPGYTAQ